MCLIDDGDEPYHVYNESHHTARKDHRCSECGRTIARGETYVRVKAHGDRWDTWRTCSHCHVAQTWLHQQCRGFLHGCVEEDIHEHFQEYHLRSLGCLLVGMRRQWRRFDGRGNLPLPKMPGEIRVGGT
jgi:hypothetical protein